jgi:hypothetical protein
VGSAGGQLGTEAVPSPGPGAAEAAPSDTDVVSSLPVPVPPDDPPMPTRFLAPASDPAGQAARSLARRVRSFLKFRGEIPGATWSVDPTAVWSVRREDACLRALDRSRVEYLRVERELTTPAPTLVQLSETPIEGVSFVSAHLDRVLEVSCELATRLPALARILKAHGIRSVYVNSSYREQPRMSFHTFGLALDIAAFKTRHNEMWLVAKHFEATPEALTCASQPATREGTALLAIACELAQSHLFSSVLTPNYNSGHRDHFHLDLRPDDPRFFLR